MSCLLPAHLLLGSAVVGLAASNLLRVRWPVLPALPLLVAGALLLPPTVRLTGAAMLFALLGWWWGGARLDGLDRSPLRAEAGRAGRALVEESSEPRVGQFGPCPIPSYIRSL